MNSGATNSVIVIGGPTASGKSGLGLALAKKLNGVVINGDSLQVYDGLPLLTAQPNEADLQEAPHRLYGAMPPEEVCSATLWREMALEEISAAHKENKIPIIVGGTGFYLKTLLVGISPIPDVPHAKRNEAAALQKELGNPGFYEALKKRDPVMAAKLDPHNTQRLVRAWEVLETTGKSLAEWQAAPRVGPPAHLRFLTMSLLPLREKLYANCNLRFSEMMKLGALDEVRKFRALDKGDTTLTKALGYTELCDFIDGWITQEEAIKRAQQSTRHYAKRQTTWFRHQIEADLVLTSPEPPWKWIEEKLSA